jgi:hypothetical protein
MELLNDVSPPKHFPKIGKLPSKPSALITIALLDLAAAEKAKQVIDMNIWCDVKLQNKKCSVCFAGAVMVGTLSNTKPVKNILAGKNADGNFPA